jgi:hypothetical protein
VSLGMSECFRISLSLDLSPNTPLLSSFFGCHDHDLGLPS